MNSAGSATGAPYNSSADDTALSSLGAARNPKRTQGRCSGQAAPARRARRASFNWRCALSTMPFDWGWYAVVREWSTPSRLHMFVHSAEQNWQPWSDVITLGTPNLATQPVKRASTQAAVSIDRSGIASSQRVDLSIMVNKYTYPSAEVGSGPTRSTWMCVKRTAGTGIGCTAAGGCLVTLALWHAVHSLHQALISEDIPRHTNLLVINRLVALIPGWARL
jgi:hypothetical protein